MACSWIFISDLLNLHTWRRSVRTDLSAHQEWKTRAHGFLFPFPFSLRFHSSSFFAFAFLSLLHVLMSVPVWLVNFLYRFLLPCPMGPVSLSAILAFPFPYRYPVPFRSVLSVCFFWLTSTLPSCGWRRAFIIVCWFVVCLLSDLRIWTSSFEMWL